MTTNKISNNQILDVIIIGAGHAGLCTSYFLSKNKLTHVVFERGKIAETWRSKRWDSFTLNTANFMNVLPGEPDDGFHREGFLLLEQVIAKLKNYATTFQLPVKENALVDSILKNPGEDFYSVKVMIDSRLEEWHSRQIVIATGAMSAPKYPTISNTLSNSINQIHVGEYRNHSLLPAGHILIIGGGQSGCQVAEDLVASGRKVYLSTAKVGRMPRRHRGKDTLDWLTQMNYYNTLTDSISDPDQLKISTPLLSGFGTSGHSISLQSLHKQGITILGSLTKIEKNTLSFASNIAENVRCGDEFSREIKTHIDDFILKEGYTTNESEYDEADQPDVDASWIENITEINCIEKQITTIKWATGLTGDFSYIKLPVLTADGKPIHKNGLSPMKGLFFIGFPWLRSRKSGIMNGMSDDAEFIAMQILKNSTANW